LDRLAVDGVDHRQGEIALPVLRPADAAGDVVAGAEVDAADLAGREVGVYLAGPYDTYNRLVELYVLSKRKRYLFSAARRKRKPSGRISSTPSAATPSPWRVSTFSTAKITSCLRARATPSEMLSCSAISSSLCAGIRFRSVSE